MSGALPVDKCSHFAPSETARMRKYCLRYIGLLSLDFPPLENVSGHANTAEEAALLVPLYRQTTVMAEEKGDEMRKVIREYAEDVVKGWDGFAAGKRNENAGRDVNEIFRVFGLLTPATKAREIIAAQFLQTYSQVILDRNKRYLQASESLSWIMWLAVVGGGVVTIGMSFILFMTRGRIF